MLRSDESDGGDDHSGCMSVGSVDERGKGFESGERTVFQVLADGRVVLLEHILPADSERSQGDDRATYYLYSHKWLRDEIYRLSRCSGKTTRLRKLKVHVDCVES